MITGKFEQRVPSPQTAVDIFAGKWAWNLQPVCRVEGTGEARLFPDCKIKLAADALWRDGRFDGATILELGPLEGAHTYQLEQLGAKRVVAVEGNTEAFLKCLVIKEILGLTSNFLCGDVVAYLTQTTEDFDIIFCSGVLYHMSDPVNLIRLISEHAPRCFAWTHYLLDDGIKPAHRVPRSVVSSGFDTVYYEYQYPNMDDDHFWGGNRPVAAWMTGGEIIRAFRHFGFTSVDVLKDDPAKAAGPAFSLAAKR